MAPCLAEEGRLHGIVKQETRSLQPIITLSLSEYHTCANLFAYAINKSLIELALETHANLHFFLEKFRLKLD